MSGYVILFQGMTRSVTLSSSKAEYAADAFAARLVGKTPAMNAFKILAQENLANLNPHPLYVKLYYSHPPIPARLRAISELSE